MHVSLCQLSDDYFSRRVFHCAFSLNDVFVHVNFVAFSDIQGGHHRKFVDGLFSFLVL